MMGRFPLPFRSLGALHGGENASYVIVGMFTDHYRAEAERLAASCERFGLAYDLHAVPTVHHSISARGTDDLSFTKANFIRHMLAAHVKPVLYMDVDCEILSPPVLIDELVRSRHDFAIYNWCADASNEFYMPIELGGNGAPETGKRYYRPAGSVLWQSDKQLLCSGCVQFYRPSLAARALLKKWHQTIASMDGCADDMVLDFTFNNLSRCHCSGSGPPGCPRLMRATPGGFATSRSSTILIFPTGSVPSSRSAIRRASESTYL